MLNQDTQDKQWTRAESVAHVAAFAAQSDAPSQRSYAREHGVPRTTLQHWLARQHDLDASPELIQFFESPVGLAFLHRLVVALHLSLGFRGACGLRLIGSTLELGGLAPFVANSFGSHQKLASSMEAKMVEFGAMERERLSVQMPPKRITVCEDETFHPEICLVAAEPVSNFLLLEAYAPRRDAATWNTALKNALDGLPVTVIQSTGDEAKALLAHARAGLGAHHSPDLFHVQQEVTRATSIGVAAQVRHAERTVVAATAALEAQGVKPQAGVQREQGAANLGDTATQGETVATEASAKLVAAHDRQERLRRAVRGIGKAYHPVKLSTGTLQTPEQLEERLEEHFMEIEAVAAEAELPSRCLDGIKKAHRLVPSLVATLAFFHKEVDAQIAELGLSSEATALVRERLVPAAYMKRAAQKAQPADTRPALFDTARALLEFDPVRGMMSGQTPEQRARIDRVVGQCADLFQRASSCVEGRNGRLSLQHHGLHNLSPRRLEALTTVHNYFIKRPDGTTAAERFFENKPADLFSWLLDHLNMPARPARKGTPVARGLN